MTADLIEPPAAPLAVPPASPDPLALYAMALDKGLDPDKLGKLLDLSERLQASRASEAFNGAMNACQSEMPAVVRDKDNPFLKSKYARLESISTAIKPVYTKHGFSLSFGTERSELPEHVRILADVLHVGGHAKRYHADIPIDGAGMKGGQNKSATQATGSTYSYGRRYLTLLIFNVTVQDEDNDGQFARKPITPEQLQILADQMDECERAGAKVDVARLFKHLRVEALEHLDQIGFAKASAALGEKRKGGAR